MKVPPHVSLVKAHVLVVYFEEYKQEMVLPLSYQSRVGLIPLHLTAVAPQQISLSNVLCTKGQGIGNAELTPGHENRIGITPVEVFGKIVDH